ncbi:MAG: TIGR03087 family PEP-CTERM/XrtA system glycosyltransferase [Magnetococcales bacterium]|nr:TIGR03087 family PEP-CTERM/XrtA system glycosyltransferase [Magnetococcales bacterium]
MKDLLFLSHRIPYPPNKGDKIRSFHLLQSLARNYRVHLGTFVDAEEDWQYVEAVKEMISGESFFAKLNPATAKLRSLSGFLTGEALTFPYYKSAKMARFVAKTLESQPIAKIVVYSAALCQYVDGKKAQTADRVVDFVDVDSDKWAQYAKDMSGAKKWFFAREAEKLLTQERKIAATFNNSFFVSRAEANLFKQLAPESVSKTDYYENGVDQEFFSPKREYKNPYPPKQIPLVFTGAMGYRPNVDAVVWFATEILPIIRQQIEACHFFIVGGGANQEVENLQRLPGVTVVGAVDDIRPYIAYAAVSVAPLRLARGIQNKVLEAMAMARPVVATSQAMEGITLLPGMEGWICDQADIFAKEVLKFLGKNRQPGDPDNQIAIKAGATGLRCVAEHYNWDKNLKRVMKVLEG